MEPNHPIRALTTRLFPRRRDEADPTSIDDTATDIALTIHDVDPRPVTDPAPGGPAHEPGSAYLVMEVLSLLRRGQDRLAEHGLPAGTLMLGPHDGDGAAAALWAHSLTDDRPRSPELDASIERILGVHPRHEGRLRTIPALDQWLRHRFGKAQAQLAPNPLVWHLSSPLGAFQALVDATTFDAGQATAIRTVAIRHILERLRIDVWHDRDTDPERADELRKHIAEIEDFDVALYRLSQDTSGMPFSRSRLELAGILSELHRRP